ncbi:hypothetical protein [Cupriavidus sp. MP-37]|uniref:hypothetical protein n=1 Tax=Cupriavidus sp. MP-37 TaxID=2884455 RepID=UPI001D09A49B|nr:hypothetical protein [Cupriavidus sp. MP-37]UDM50758.1 hypothetical protein LIN44_02895 [Cupriavidus sp. MP-37]
MINGIIDDCATRFEAATEILNTLIALCEHDLSSEQTASALGQARIDQLHDRRRALVLMRRALDPSDLERIEQILKEEGAAVRSRMDELRSAARNHLSAR